MSSALLFFLFFLSLLALGVFVRSKVMAPFERKIHRPLPDEPTYVAWLSGGAKRVAETWWTQLHNAGFLVSSAHTGKDKKITINPRADLSHLELHTRRAAQVLAHASTRTSLQILEAWKKPIEQVHKEIEQTGWVHYTHEITGRGALVRSYMGVALIGGVLGIFLLGWSVWLALGALATALTFAFTTTRPPRLTEHGKKMLQDLQTKHKHSTLAPNRSDMGMAVAIAGTVVLLGTPWQAYASPAQHPRGENNSSSSCSGGCATVAASWGGSDGSGCGSGDSGGCGGGGCGGGGCGG